jgi:D-glycero-D-manno-heptose 1,7-bisphosphate phosphatase
MTTLATLSDLHARMCAAVSAAGGDIRDIFFCPHRPDQNCSCRKPRAGLILSARDRYDIDLSRACMVGDSAKDITAARNAGVRLTLLVRTGNGAETEKTLSGQAQRPNHVAADLCEAVDWIIAHDHLFAP